MELVDMFESRPLTEAEMKNHILAFCLQNGTAAELFDQNENRIYKIDLSQPGVCQRFECLLYNGQ